MTQPPLPPAPDSRPQEYVADASFDDLGLSPELKRAVLERGYTNPTPVQAKAFGPAKAGKDLIVRSKTGTGKTAAFGMPLIERIPMGTRGVRALIMCPTRELALQVAQELEALSKYRDITVCTIYGGASMQQQIDALKHGAAIVVGTPGRVHDHIRRGNLKLDQCSHAILDEADEMLNQGFYEEVTRILDTLPKEKQVLLFSATVPEDIQRLIHKYTKEPETLLLSGDVYTVEHINHLRYELSDEYPKPRNLLYVLELEDPENAIVFCNTRDDTELVTAVLNRNGFDAELLNGDLPQKERERVMGRIKRGEVAFMVATDLAARGIDISDLGHVINYSLPEDPAVYLHRVGRTGRIGKKGTAINLTSGRELATLTALEKKYGIKFERKNMPSPEDAMRLWAERHVKEVLEASHGSIFEGFLGLAQEFKSRPDANELIAFLLKYFFTHRRIDKASHHPDEAPPRAAKPEGRRDREERGDRRRDRGPRGDRPERGDRPDRSERPRREHREHREERAAEPTTEPLGTPAVERTATQPDTQLEVPAAESKRTRSSRPKSDRELFETTPSIEVAGVREVPATRPAAPAVAATNGGRGGPQTRGLTDREIFERLQKGLPIPEAVDDPTEAPEADAGASSDERPRRERGDRGERGERSRGRRERKPADVEPVAPGMVKLWLNLGRADGVDAASLASALEGAGAPAGKLAKADVMGTFSYVQVAEADVAAFEALGGKTHGSKAIKIERAREKR